MSAEELALQAAREVGAPMVALYLMWRMGNTTIRENTAAINKLNEAVTRLCEKHNGGG
jgi:hypothetical protein